MPGIAQVQLQRIVALVAWMSQRDTPGPVPWAEVAGQVGVSEANLRADVQVLIDLTDRHKDWLASLSVAITATGLILESRGAFRRPLRLSRDEALVLVTGLTGVAGGHDLAARIGATFDATTDAEDLSRQYAVGPAAAPGLASMLALGRRARDERRRLDLLYCGSDGEPSRRTIHVHQVVQGRGAWYLVAWCERAEATRRFRAERIMELTLLEDHFEPQPDPDRVTTEEDLLVADSAPSATIVFNSQIARWMRERYPAGAMQSDGSYLVQIPVADPHWLAREVLQYGAAAEVRAPAAMREYLRGMLAD